MRKAKMLRLNFYEDEKYQGKPLYEAIFNKCHAMGIAGVTVLRGLEGYDDTAEIHRHHLVTHDQPIVVVIVDEDERIQELLPVVESMMDTGLIAMSDVEMVRVTNK